MLIPNPIRFVGAMFRSLWFRLRGYDVFAFRGAREFRELTCKLCPEYHTPADQCRVCRCFVVPKAALASERCPRGFWREVFARKGMVIWPPERGTKSHGRGFLARVFRAVKRDLTFSDD